MGEQETSEIDIDSLQPNPLQPRGQILPDSLVELAESVREHGILEPLLVAKTPAGYQIVAGERRWRAAKLAGLTRIPAIIKETTPQGMLEMALVENVQRSDLNSLERAQAFNRLINEFGLTAVEIGRRIGKSGPYVSNTLRLLDLPDALKDGLLSNTITEGHAKALLGLEETSLIIGGYKEVLKENLGVRSTEDLVRKLKAKEQIKPRRDIDYEVTPELEQMETEIANNLDCRVRLLKSARGGRVTLFFSSEDQLNKIHKLLTS